MTRLQWFRMYTEARTDRKLAAFTDEEFRVWFNLLCYSAESEPRGVVAYNGDNEILALEVAGGDEDLLSRAVTRMSRLHILDEDEGYLVFRSFAERQYDKPSDLPEAARERKRRQRAKEGTDE